MLSKSKCRLFGFAVCLLTIVALSDTSAWGVARDVSPGSVTGAAGDALVVPLIIDDAAGIDAFGMKLTFDTTQLTFVGVSKTALTVDFVWLAGHEAVPGVITIGGIWPGYTIPAGKWFAG